MDAYMLQSFIYMVEMGWKKILGLLKKTIFFQSFVCFFMFIGRSLSLLHGSYVLGLYTVSFMHMKKSPIEIV